MVAAAVAYQPAIWSSERSVETGAIITPAAPRSITRAESSPMPAKPGAETPTTTGTRPATRFRKRSVTAALSAAVSFGASPIMPSTVRPVTPRSR